MENNHVLTLSKSYFQLRKPLERRLYEIARKHCGKQPKWEIGLGKQKGKAGSLSTDKEFKRILVKVISDNQTHNNMPDYSFELTAATQVRHIRRGETPRSRMEHPCS